MASNERSGKRHGFFRWGGRLPWRFHAPVILPARKGRVPLRVEELEGILAPNSLLSSISDLVGGAIRR